MWARELTARLDLRLGQLLRCVQRIRLCSWRPEDGSTGDWDGFLRKYNAQGNLIWTRQIGTPDTDQATGVAADASGVYVVGYTHGTLPGQTVGREC